MELSRPLPQKGDEFRKKLSHQIGQHPGRGNRRGGGKERDGWRDFLDLGPLAQDPFEEGTDMVDG